MLSRTRGIGLAALRRVSPFAHPLRDRVLGAVARHPQVWRRAHTDLALRGSRWAIGLLLSFETTTAFAAEAVAALYGSGAPDPHPATEQRTEPSPGSAGPPETSGNLSPISDFALLASIGGFSTRGQEDGDGQAGAALGMMALFRRSSFAIGGSFPEIGAGIGGANVSGCGLFGASLRAESGWRLDVLGSVGLRYYRWGVGLLSDDPGAAAWLPYAGGRVQGSYLLGHRSQHHFAVGAMVALDSDLMTVRRQYDYEETPWLTLFDGNEEPYLEHADHVIGGRRLWVGLTFGWVRDLS